MQKFSILFQESTVIILEEFEQNYPILDVIKCFFTVVTDEIYRENTFDGNHRSFASYPELRNKLFLLHGLSKAHAMTGWRIGYVLGPSGIMQQVLKVHLYNSICASLPSQYAAIEALTSNRHTPEMMNKAYIKRRNFVQKRLEDMGLHIIQPEGAFYIFPSIKYLKITSYNFATKLLK